MAKKTIQNLWAQSSSNKQTFTEDEIASGIEYKGPVVSNQLNGVSNDLYTYTDQLQRAGTAWNPLKKYEIGDVVEVRAIHNSEQLIAKFACIIAGNAAPLVNNGASSFILDSDKNVCIFNITDDGTKTLKHYLGSSWTMLKDESGYYISAKTLQVVNKATFEQGIHSKGYSGFDAGCYITNGGYLHTTPALTASGDELVNASWVRQNYNMSDYLKGKTWKQVLFTKATGVVNFSENISVYRYIRLEGKITRSGYTADSMVWYGEIALLKSIGEQIDIINIAGAATNYVMRNLTDTSITISQYNGTGFCCSVWVI